MKITRNGMEIIRNENKMRNIDKNRININERHQKIKNKNKNKNNKKYDKKIEIFKITMKLIIILHSL